MQTDSKTEVFEQIVKGLQTFPYQMQVEVLDFIGFLKNKLAAEQARKEEEEWSYLSLSKVLSNTEDEKEEEYSEADLKEKWL